MEILTNLPKDKNERILWREINEGTKIKVKHKKYGVRSFIFKKYDNNKRLYLLYNGEECKPIFVGSFKAGNIGSLIKEYKRGFTYDIGYNFKDEKRDVTIIDKKLIEKELTDSKTKKKYIGKQKYYKYHCNKCSNEDWIIEHAIIPKQEGGQGVGCNVCCHNPQKTVLGINTIWDKARWMCDLGVSEEDAKKYTPQSRKKIEVSCPLCGEKKKVSISYVYRNHSIGCICSDHIPSGEKAIYSILKQLVVDFKFQLTKRDFKWCDKFRYDFYIPSINAIIETNGEQHYKETTNFKTSLEDIVNNDKTKKELALKNKIKNYIVIDCRETNFDYIKENILNSELSLLLDLSVIDWGKCEEFIFNKNLIKIACNYKKDNPNLTTSEIGEIMGFNYNTIRDWLKTGNKLGWCEYDSKEEKIKKYKKVICVETGIIYDKISIAEKLTNSRNVGACCRGERNYAGKLPDGTKLHWEYVEE